MVIPRLYFLKEDEQLVIESFTRREVMNGPGRYVSKLFEKVTRRKALMLGPTDYVRLRNTLTGELHNVDGPRLYFLKANEEVDRQLKVFPLLDNQYVRLIDTKTGKIRIVRGPATVYIEPTEEMPGDVEQGVNLDDRTGVLVREISTGKLNLITGTQLFIPSAGQEIIETRRGIVVDETTAVLVRDIASGQLSMIREPQVFIPDENQETVEVRRGVNLDDETAVLVRDVTSGQLSLITEKQVFIPDENQEIAEVRTLIRLEDHQTVIIRDREGRYTFRRGSDTERAFFLQPYTELVTLWWSAGLHKDQRNLKLTHIDSRPRYMWYEFDVRTQDNVELVIGTTFFWQIVDVEAMIKMTDDATGNISSHARSTIIQAVSRVTLERFLADFNTLVRDAVIGTNDTFYSERGATIHAVEVRSVACKDPQTQQILMEIIQETTNRLNRLQKQESENEVSLKKLQGEIETEAARGQLLEARRTHSQTESLTQGEAEANRVRVLLEGLGDGLSTADKLAIFTTLRKQEMLDALSKGKATLYFTPSDVDLTIK